MQDKRPSLVSTMSRWTSTLVVILQACNNDRREQVAVEPDTGWYVPLAHAATT